MLLVPGWSDRARHLHRLRDRFLAAGWPASHVQMVDFADRFGGNVAHAAEIARSIAELLDQTRASRVDVVAHSMGGLSVRQYLHFGDGARHVRRVVFTGTPHSGTWVAYLGWGAGARDMRPGSRFLRALNALPPVPGPVEALCISTPTDLRVVPGRSARLAGARCKRVWCVSHARMLHSGRVFEAVRGFLSK